MDGSVSPVSLAFVLGLCVGDPKRRVPGRLAALAQELRVSGRWAELVGPLDAELRRSVELMVSVDRAKTRRAGQQV